MTANQQEYLKKIHSIQENLAKTWAEYWQQYSTPGSWQFWVTLGAFILPLVILYFFIDRKKAFHLGFYGFNVHVWFHYSDTAGVYNGLWTYPYQINTIIPVSFSLDASLIPVSFMLLYQWTINHHKNYYVYATVLCLFFAFIFKPLLTGIGFFQLHEWATYSYLFVVYLGVILLSKWITNLFLYFEKQH
ncbi:CBO0543 family protein [Priestia megaterium]|uniref:CBO0543 family protein n=1 Tax=Priestia megaterium TaxID=1404 RepID=UPI003CFB9E82